MRFHPPAARRSGAERARWRSLGIGAGGTADMIRRVGEGFPYAAFVHFQKRSGLPPARIAELVQLPPRTLMRRKAAGRLRPDESERLLRICGIFEQAVELFEGDSDAARLWLTTPSPELGGAPPLEFARTEIGAREVEDLIGRLQYGVFT